MKIDVILEPGATAATAQAVAALSDQYGIGTVWGSSFPARRDPFLTLVPAAAATRKVRLGVMPVSPYEHHPVKLADTLLTFNELCEGRASILLGGMGKSIMNATGLEPVRRVRAVKECVEILRATASGKMVDYQGQVYSANYAADWLGQPAPRLYIAANKPQMLRLAGQLGDGLMLSDVPLGRMDEVMREVDKGLAQSGRSSKALRVNNFWAWHIKEDAAAARREARREVVWRGVLEPWYTEAFLTREEAGFVQQNFGAFLQAFMQRTHVIEGVPDELVDRLVDNLTFTGGPGAIDTVISHLRDFQAAGLDEVAFRLHDDPEDAVRLIGERVVPVLS